MSLQQLYLVLLAGGLVLLASIVATRAATRVGLPSLLLFLGVGVIVGEDGLGLHFDNYLLADHLGTVALAIILIEGGLTTKFGDVRKVLAPAASLATVGVAVSMAVTAAGAHLLLGIDWQLALLLGAVVSVTDAAAVFSVLRVVPLPRRVAGLLEAESGFNDAPAVILVLMFSAVPAIWAGKAHRVGLSQCRIGEDYPGRKGAKLSYGICRAGRGADTRTNAKPLSTRSDSRRALCCPDAYEDGLHGDPPLSCEEDHELARSLRTFGECVRKLGLVLPDHPTGDDKWTHEE